MYISPPQNHALKSFENGIYDMVRNIEFRKVRKDFQDKFKEDINEIRFFQKLICFCGQVSKLV